MKVTRLIMDMPVIVEIVDAHNQAVINDIFAFFQAVDNRLSPFKPQSELSRFNRGELPVAKASTELKSILKLAAETKQATHGYFDIYHHGICDPSGLVKGWAINQAARILAKRGLRNFYVEAGGDIQVSGHNPEGQPWRIGIQSPFNLKQIMKVVSLVDRGIATSGTYRRGQHIYDPVSKRDTITEIVGLTVIAPNIYDADRFATAAFAMGSQGINFIDQQPDLAGLMIDRQGTVTLTPTFEAYAATG